MPCHKATRVVLSRAAVSSRFSKTISRGLTKTFLLLALAFSFASVHLLAQENVITNGSTWRWRPGTNEVSTPFTAWRTNGFNDATWLTGTAPFSYGTNVTGR